MLRGYHINGPHSGPYNKLTAGNLWSDRDKPVESAIITHYGVTEWLLDETVAFSVFQPQSGQW